MTHELLIKLETYYNLENVYNRGVYHDKITMAVE